MTHQPGILVIDDEQIMRDGCIRILSKEGWNVFTAENGRQGLDLIQTRAEETDVVLLDLMMPGMSGMEVLDRIRATRQDLLVVVITGYATVELAVEAMKKGAYDFISKPFTPDQLRIVVRRAIERRILEKEAEFLRREREKSLRDVAAEQSRIKTIINCMADGVLVVDREGYLVLSNPVATRMLSISEECLLGKPFHECGIPQELSGVIEETLHPKNSAYASVSQELSLGQGGETFLRAHTASVRNDRGEIMGAVTVLQDISHLKQLDRMKSEFIAMVAHELRSPIAAVEQQITVILNRLAGEITEKQEQLLNRARERTKAVLDLIKDLLDLSKIEAGKMVQYKEPLSILEVVERVVDLLRPEAEAKGIDLELSISEPVSLIAADRNSMEGVFNNLVSNALKYTPKGGKVSVSISEEGSFVKVVVADTGIGIPKEDLPRIFDRFYRVKSAETRQIAGSGLGLSIAKSIVEAHFGTITVDSELGRGSIFTVLLPREIRF